MVEGQDLPYDSGYLLGGYGSCICICKVHQLGMDSVYAHLGIGWSVHPKCNRQKDRGGQRWIGVI